MPAVRGLPRIRPLPTHAQAIHLPTLPDGGEEWETLKFPVRTYAGRSRTACHAQWLLHAFNSAAQEVYVGETHMRIVRRTGWRRFMPWPFRGYAGPQYYCYAAVCAYPIDYTESLELDKP